MTDSTVSESSSTTRRWQPLSAIDRRVAGVLVEKAKTTPEAYPLSLNAVVTACNQKNNRFPTMEVDSDEVQAALDRLRGLGAVGLVQGTSRVDRFRHLLKDWLGVDGVELAVMAELLLRGAQTEGELRGRAARMEPIVDLTALRPVLDSLRSKGLIVSLTREGRGHVLTHALYEPRELERLRGEHGSGAAADERESRPPTAHARELPSAGEATRQPAVTAASTPVTVAPQRSVDLHPAIDPRELIQLRDQVRQTQEIVADLQAAVDDCRREIQELREALGA